MWLQHNKHLTIFAGFYLILIINLKYCKMKNFLLLTCVSICLLGLFAKKEARGQADTTKFYRWEVGTDLLWLIDKNTLPPTTLFLKINNKWKHMQGAFRFRVGYDYEDKDTLMKSPNSDRVVNSTFQSYFGYEVHKRLNPKLNLYCAIDFYYSVTKKEEIWEWINPYDHVQMKSIRNTNIETYGLTPVFGAGYDIAKNINISIETSGYFNYKSGTKKLRNRSKKYFQKRGPINSQYNYESHKIGFNPIHSINVNIKF